MNHWSRSPGRMSQLRAVFFRCSSRIPPWPCTIAFGRPGGARREEDVERVRERHRLELERAVLRQQLVPRERVGEHVVGAARVGDVDDGLQARQPLAHRGHLLAAVDELVAPAVAGDGEQHLRLELAEAVRRRCGRRTPAGTSPRRAEARGREEGDERLGDVRQVGDDAVAGADAEPLQAGAGARDLLAQLAEGELAWPARLRARDDRDRAGVLVAAEHVLGVVEPRAGEPLGARHLARAEHPLVRRVRADLEEVPERRPEALEVARPTSATARRSRRSRGRARGAARSGSARAPSCSRSVRRGRPDDAPAGGRPASGSRHEHGAAGDLALAEPVEHVVHVVERVGLRAQRDLAAGVELEELPEVDPVADEVARDRASRRRRARPTGP